IDAWRGVLQAEVSAGFIQEGSIIGDVAVAVGVGRGAAINQIRADVIVGSAERIGVGNDDGVLRRSFEDAGAGWSAGGHPIPHDRAVDQMASRSAAALEGRIVSDEAVYQSARGCAAALLVGIVIRDDAVSQVAGVGSAPLADSADEKV